MQEGRKIGKLSSRRFGGDPSKDGRATWVFATNKMTVVGGRANQPRKNTRRGVHKTNRSLQNISTQLIAEQRYNAGKDQGITVAVGEQNGFTRRVTLVPHQHTHVHRKRGEKEERQRLAVRTFILSRKYTLKEFRQHTSENAGVMKAKLTAQEQHAFTRRVHAPAQH